MGEGFLAMKTSMRGFDVPDDMRRLREQQETIVRENRGPVGGMTRAGAGAAAPDPFARSAGEAWKRPQWEVPEGQSWTAGIGGPKYDAVRPAAAPATRTMGAGAVAKPAVVDPLGGVQAADGQVVTGRDGKRYRKTAVGWVAAEQVGGHSGERGVTYNPEEYFDESLTVPDLPPVGTLVRQDGTGMPLRRTKTGYEALRMNGVRTFDLT